MGKNGSKIKIKFNVKWTGIIKGQIQIEFIPKDNSLEYSTELNSRFLVTHTLKYVTKTVTKMVTNNGLDRAREHHLSWPFKSVFPFFLEKIRKEILEF